MGHGLESVPADEELLRIYHQALDERVEAGGAPAGVQERRMAATVPGGPEPLVRAIVGSPGASAAPRALLGMLRATGSRGLTADVARLLGDAEPRGYRVRR